MLYLTNLTKYHLETLHPEGESPFVVKEDLGSSKEPSETEEAIRTFNDEMEFLASNWITTIAKHAFNVEICRIVNAMCSLKKSNVNSRES